MKRTRMLLVLALALIIPATASAGSDLKKVIAIGHVNTGFMGFSSMDPKALSELFRNRIKVALEKTGRYVVVLPKAKEAKEIDFSQHPEPKTAAEAMQQAAQMQKMVREMMAQAQGHYVHQPVAAQALFNFTIGQREKGVDTGGLFSEAEYWTGLPVGSADQHSESVELSLTCMALDPESGRIEGEHTARASHTRFYRGGGMSYYTAKNSGDPDKAFGRMFKKATKNCVQWIEKRLEKQPWEGQLFQKRGGQFLLNAGSNAGLSKGTPVLLQERKSVSGKGLELGSELAVVGRGTISAVKEEYAIVSPSSGAAKVGQIVTIDAAKTTD